MIHYTLKCQSDHRFEGWFRSATDFEDQAARGEIECPVCADKRIGKALMTPNLPAKTNSRRPASQNPHPPVLQQPPAGGKMTMGAKDAEAVAQAWQMLRQLHKHVREQCDDVGDDFASEARRIHYGEAEERGIYGQTSPDEAAELLDEGIAIAALPTLPEEN